MPEGMTGEGQGERGSWAGGHCIDCRGGGEATARGGGAAERSCGEGGEGVQAPVRTRTALLQGTPHCPQHTECPGGKGGFDRQAGGGTEGTPGGAAGVARCPRRGHVSQPSAAFCCTRGLLVVAACLLAVQGQPITTPAPTPAPVPLNPKFWWRESRLFECLEYGNANRPTLCTSVKDADGTPKVLLSATQNMACTSVPSTTYVCTSPTDLGCTCKSECAAVVTDAATFPAACLKTTFAIEDTWSKIPTYIRHENADGTFAEWGSMLFNGVANQGDMTFVQITILVSYGTVDLYDTESKCQYSSTDPQVCTIETSSQLPYGPANLDDRPLSLVYRNYLTRSTDSVEMVMMGTFKAMSLAMDALMYRPDSQQNSKRLRSRFYSSAAAREQPYELMKVTVGTSSSQGGPFTDMETLSQLVHIVDVNDAPELEHPSEGYTIPAVCAVDRFHPSCHFGQFFSYEDSPESVQVQGLNIIDVDIYEACTSIKQECKTLDVSVRAQRGAIGLNTRSNLVFYESTRSKQGFTSVVSSAVSATKVIIYQTETDTILQEGTSTVKDYNTQNGGNTEAITVVVSDQGNSGSDNLSQLSSIVIRLTIVAKNDAPSISVGVAEFAMREDLPAKLPGLSVADVDVDERIVSSLATLDWTGELVNQQLLNKMSITIEVTYGYLRLTSFRGLTLVATKDIEVFSIVNVPSFFGHDTCRQSALVEKAAQLSTYVDDSLNLVTVNSLRSVCAFSNVGLPACPTGSESTCTCLFDNSCDTDDTIIIYLNKTRITDYMDVLELEISGQEKTCGGLPTYSAPNNFSYGVPCNNDEDCNDFVLPACAFGFNCTCCANASDPCTQDSDCFKYDLGSPCGCMAGYPIVGSKPSGTCGPFCTKEDPDNKEEDCVITNFLSYPNKLYGGTPCTYRSPIAEAKGTPVIRECRASTYVEIGSSLSRVLELVSRAVSPIPNTPPGSRFVEFLGSRTDVNQALKDVVYQTNPVYNRLFRIPVEERDPVSFDIEVDSLDSFSIQVSDLGNSGGERRDINVVGQSVGIRVAAVNNAPTITGPDTIQTKEDVPYHITSLRIDDPDYNDYGFKELPLLVNLSCSNGRLFLNEDFLRTPGIANTRITFKDWNEGVTTYTGLHTIGVNLQAQPAFGAGCQFFQSCTDGSDFTSADTKFGYYATERWGKVYAGNGCGSCSELVGNQFLSIQGVLDDLNLALSFVTYLPDPNFNTRAGGSEAIVVRVSDNGALGDEADQRPLTAEQIIEVQVESVNDRPIIGRRVTQNRDVASFYEARPVVYTKGEDTAILAINSTITEYCHNLAPTSAEYTRDCGPGIRTYIDVDEDTEFIVTPDILFIDDVDSEEAERIAELNPPAPPRTIPQNSYCCNGKSCRCGSDCLCGTGVCDCPTPTVCSTGTFGWLLVDLQVKHGELTFTNPQGRKMPDNMLFVTNSTTKDIRDGGGFTPCRDESLCRRNASRITLTSNKAEIQTSLSQLFLTYRGLPNFYGEDELSVWVSDLNHTDECYNETLIAQNEIGIRVVAVNDDPMIRKPNTVLQYPQGARCFINYHRFIETSLIGINPECLKSNNTRIPPGDDGFGQELFFSDIDLEDRPRTFLTETGLNAPLEPQLTLIVTIGTDKSLHENAGEVTIVHTKHDTYMSFESFRNSDGLQTIAMQGTLTEVNELMRIIRFDTHPDYNGYLPVRVTVNDNGNFGECSGAHVCGQNTPCADHTTAEAHAAPRQGVLNTAIDLSIGGTSTCDATDCNRCQALPGCGWCPSSCPQPNGRGGGKCMRGGPAGPTFETCDPDFEGKGFGQCSKSTFPLAVVIGASVGAFVIITLALFIFLRWVRRRHGTLWAYIVKKRDDFLRSGRQLGVIPDAAANWVQFFLGVIITIVLFISFASISSSEPLCVFNHQFILSKAKTFHLDVDNCNVRFLPAKSAEYPNNLIESLKVRIAITSDPAVTVTGDVCEQAANITIRNGRSDTVRYVDYYCSVEILVPDKFVIPAINIVDTGTNVTTVRGGAMDVDSAGFDLNFGPNSLSISAEQAALNVRMDGITCKSFNYNAKRGNLFVENLRTSETAVFESQSADITVTTPQRTSVEFEQKSGNLACLSAANNSAYIDNSCEEVCRNRPAVPFVQGTQQGEITVDPWLCREASLGDKVLYNCTEYDPEYVVVENRCPVGAKYTQKSDVPQVLGCTDLDNCVLTETPQCLCRPACDMAGLTPPGTCNELGECCQTICQGKSKADLFPTANQPRCGRLIDPIGQNWCNGDLDQKWTLTSVTGQLTVQVFENAKDKLVHSYKGSAPSLTVDSTPAMSNADRALLDEVFHPGGEDSPGEDWFALRLQGPGTTERAEGQFVWTRSLRNLVVVPWVLSVASFGLLEPPRAESFTQLNPAFCPAVLTGSEREIKEVQSKRLVQQKELLEDATTNVGNTTKAFPFLSLLAYIPTGQYPRTFVANPITNKIDISEVVPFDEALIVAIFGLAFGVPVVSTIVLAVLCFRASNERLRVYRKDKILEEQVSNNIGTALRRGKDTIQNEVEFMANLNKRAMSKMVARTNFFYLLDDFLGLADVSRSVYWDLIATCAHMIFTVWPVAVVISINRTFETSYLQYRCLDRPDKCSCLREQTLLGSIPFVVDIFIYIYLVISVLESSFYYLAVEYNRGLRILRKVFFTIWGIMTALAIDVVLTVLIFIFLGMLMHPLRVTPYALAVVGVAANGVALYMKQTRFQERVTRAVQKRITQFRGKLSRIVPPLLLEVMLRKNVRQAFHHEGLSVPRITGNVIIYCLVLVLVYAFLFVGFNAFTDPRDTVAAVINSSVVVAIAVCAQQTVAKDGEEEDVKEKIEVTQEKVIANLKKVFDMVTRQVLMAKQLFIQMQRAKGYDVSGLGESMSDEEEDRPTTESTYSDTDEIRPHGPQRS